MGKRRRRDIFTPECLRRFTGTSPARPRAALCGAWNIDIGAAEMGPKGTMMFAIMLAGATAAFLLSGSKILAVAAAVVLYPIAFFL